MKTSKLVNLFIVAGSVVSSPAPALAANFTVQMTSGFVFSPASLNIGQGDTVTWTNTAAFHHDTTSGPNAPVGDGLWTAGTVNAAGKFAFTFNDFAPRTYPFFCSFHYNIGMLGSLTVTNGTVVPPVVANPAFAVNGAFQLNINGLIGLTNVTESSPDLLNWSPVSTNLTLATSFTVTNLPASGLPINFYRVRAVQ